ncbi:hypothetical protein D3C76_667670 [compost metagenome]
MSSLPRYLQSAVNDKVISLAQALQLQQVLIQPLPSSPSELEQKVRELSLLLCLHQLDCNKMTKH